MSKESTKQNKEKENMPRRFKRCIFSLFSGHSKTFFFPFSLVLLSRSIVAALSFISSFFHKVQHIEVVEWFMYIKAFFPIRYWK